MGDGDVEADGPASPIGLARQEFEARFGADVDDLSLVEVGPTRRMLEMCLAWARIGVSRVWSRFAVHRDAALAAALGRDPAPMPYVNYLEMAPGASRFGAKADRGPTIELIALYTSTPYILHEVFCSMMSHPDVLPAVGTRRLEVSSPKRLRIPRRSAEIPVLTIPRDPVRWQYAVVMAGIASTFISVHEVAHHLFGHLAYLEPVRRGASNESVVPDDREWRALEFDADCFAAYDFIANALNTDLADVTTTISSRGANSHLFKACFAVHTGFFLARALTRHPPPDVRQSVAGMMVPAVCERLGVYPIATEASNVALRAFQSSELALKEIAEDISDVPVLLTGLTREKAERLFYDEIDSLAETWATLRPKLLPFSRADPAPAGVEDVIAAKARRDARRNKSSTST